MDGVTEHILLCFTLEYDAGSWYEEDDYAILRKIFFLFIDRSLCVCVCVCVYTCVCLCV